MIYPLTNIIGYVSLKLMIRLKVKTKILWE